MSKYTMQLREIYSPTLQYSSPFFTKDEVIGWFEDYELTDYLTSDEISVINTRGTWNKHKLATKIVNHYAMREIGFETMGLFRDRAKVFMNELMEEYLPLIYSASIEYDPLINIDYSETYSHTLANNQTGSNTTTSQVATTNSNTSSGLDVESDTPQGQITKATILNGNYATSTNANESTSSDTTNSSSNGTSNLTNNEQLAENSTKHIIGNSGVSATAQKMIALYRDNIRAIDREIINKCNVLFMGIY